MLPYIGGFIGGLVFGMFMYTMGYGIKTKEFWIVCFINVTLVSFILYFRSK